MKIYIAGNKQWHSLQSPRIEAALISLGHGSTHMYDADLIYCNDPSSYDDVVKYRKDSQKVIFNILDVPYHIAEFEQWKKNIIPKLSFADIVTCISKTVQNDIKQHLDIDAHVIYNPIKDITRINYGHRHQNFIYVGRANDAGKRYRLIEEMVYNRNFKDCPTNINVFGSERPAKGIYNGIVKDYQLNLAYNSFEYMIYPSKFEGIGLPPIEFIMAGGYPILTNDNPTFREIYPDFMLADPTPEALYEKYIEIKHDKNKKEYITHYLSPKLYATFNKYSVAENILKLI